MEASALLAHAKSIMQTIINHGYEAYIVGGYVRDRLLDRPIKDIDLATSALPEQVMSWFTHTVPTGLQHGTVTVIVSGCSYEVTTFRIEEKYVDNRKPGQVHFIKDLHEDLKRRDFTINAMAMDIHEQVIDPFGGKADLASHLLRTVGLAHDRFKEDALRMLRCIRFAAEYGLKIEEETWKALCEDAKALKPVAMERVRMELEKAIEGSDPSRALQLLIQSELLKYCKEDLDLPWNRWKSTLDVSWHALNHMNKLVRWVDVIERAGFSPDEARSFLRKLTFSNKKMDHICSIVDFHHALAVELLEDRANEINDTSQASLASGRFSEIDLLFKSLAVQYGTSAAEDWIHWIRILQDHQGLTTALPEWNQAYAKHLLRFAHRWLHELPIQTVSELAVRGQDFIKLAPAGPWIGIVMDKLLYDVALGTVPNDKNLLLERAEMYRSELIGND